MSRCYDLRPYRLALHALTCGSAVSKSRTRRALIEEANTILKFILKAPPSSSSLKLYVRAIQSLRDYKPIGLPAITIRWPLLIALFDTAQIRRLVENNEFCWRMQAAVRIAEASGSHQKRFLGTPTQYRFFRSCLGILLALSLDSVWQLISSILFYLYPKYFSLNKTSDE